MAPLAPCSSCRRHIRVNHESCPFCGSTVPVGFASRVVPPAKKRLDRLATFSFATTLAVAACGEIQPEPGAGTGTSQNSNPSQVAADAGTTAPRGATPQPDAGKRSDAGLVQDEGGVAAEYGAPPDAGFDDDGGISADYGQPPIFDAGQD